MSRRGILVYMVREKNTIPTTTRGRGGGHGGKCIIQTRGGLTPVLRAVNSSELIYLFTGRERYWKFGTSYVTGNVKYILELGY